MKIRAAIPLLAVTLSVSQAADVDFDTHVRPILSDNCFQCHGPDKATREADLRLDTRQGAFADSAGHAAFVAGSVERSEALRRIFSDDVSERMPPPESKLSLTDREKQTLKAWVSSGAKWSEHWSFVTPTPPQVPADDSGWSRNEIDRFVLARAQAAGLNPQRDAPRETLIRRVTLDLTGVPPTPADVDAFVADQSENAYEKVVDRLLSSPRYGERMAWEWLDAARYADTDGFQGDPTRTMWPWRDWLVNALNSNMPFDQFTIEMLAGDLLANAGEEQILATGFNRNHMFNGEGGRIPEETRVENVFDRTETTATVWLGLTMTCCRCHDHKYDAISQQEYFQLYAFFDNTSEDGRSGRGATAPLLQFLPPDQRQRRDAVADALREIETKLAADEQGTEQLAAERERLSREQEELRKQAVPVMVMDDLKGNRRRQTQMLERGGYDKPTGVVVTADTPAALPPLPQDTPRDRLALARWLVDPANPLTARVTVNRFWQTLFGRGIVESTEDFGSQGTRPTHPELLDWLAIQFMDNGWNVRELHKLIVMSSTYRQSSDVTQHALDADPGNRWLARAPRHRLPSWMLRDQALAVSGLLNPAMGRPSVNPYQPDGVWAEATFGKIRYVPDTGARLYRRSLYVFWRRIVGPTMFFDSAKRQACEVKPTRTNTPLHALTTLNETMFVEAARAMAERVIRSGETQPERLQHAFRLATSRRAGTDEIEVLSRRIDAFRADFAANPDDAKALLSVGESPRDESLDVAEHAAFTLVCSVLLNLDETLSRQ